MIYIYIYMLFIYLCIHMYIYIYIYVYVRVSLSSQQPTFQTITTHQWCIAFDGSHARLRPPTTQTLESSPICEIVGWDWELCEPGVLHLSVHFCGSLADDFGDCPLFPVKRPTVIADCGDCIRRVHTKTTQKQTNFWLAKFTKLRYEGAFGLSRPRSRVLRMYVLCSSFVHCMLVTCS